MVRSVLFSFFFFFAILLAGAVSGANIFVSPEGSNANPGTKALPFQTINHAVSVANDGDDILLETGVYNETVTIVDKILSLATASGLPDVILKPPFLGTSLFSVSDAKLAFFHLTFNGELMAKTCVNVATSSVNMTGCVLHNCITALSASAGSSILADNCTFTHNTLGIANSGTASVNASSFLKNTKSVEQMTGIFTAVGSSFVENTAGSITADNGAVVNLIQCIVANNTAQTGAVSCGTSTLIVNASRLSNNTAASVISSGYFCQLTVVGSVFLDNARGAISSKSLYVMTVNGSIFQNNEGNLAGAIFIESGEAKIDNCSFVNNSGSDRGGAIYKQQGSLIVTNSIFTANKCVRVAGGAIFNQDGSLTVNGTSFIRNTAPGAGAIASTRSVVQVSNSSFLNCSATTKDGGAVVLFSGKAVFTDTTFKNNRAANNGGGAYIQNIFVAITWMQVTFDCNVAGGKGNNYFEDNAELTCLDCSVVQCPE